VSKDGGNKKNSTRFSREPLKLPAEWAIEPLEGNDKIGISVSQAAAISPTRHGSKNILRLPSGLCGNKIAIKRLNLWVRLMGGQTARRTQEWARFFLRRT